MKSEWKNAIHIEGYVFSHSLQERVTGSNSKAPGTKFIMGDINVATDDQAMNVVTVHFTYVTEKYTKSGKDNATYGVLKQIIDENKTYEVCGTQAMKVRIDGSVELNDFYTRDGELASPKRINGSFCHLLNGPIAMNSATFNLDMVITKAIEKEVESGDNYMTIDGYVFNFRNDILPIQLTMRSPEGMKYFGSQDISVFNPLVTCVWGNIVSSTVESKTEVESAFGAPTVKISTRTFRSWDIEGASAEPMVWGEAINADDIKKALDAREVYLAGEKKRTEEYRNSKSGQSGFPAAAVETKSASASPTFNSDYRF